MAGMSNLSDEEFRNRVAEVASATASPADSLWWLSFADSDLPEGAQFLGACLVEAGNLPAAVTKTHLLGINPGGEVQIVGPFDPSVAPDNYPRDTLLSQEDIKTLDGEG